MSVEVLGEEEVNQLISVGDTIKNWEGLSVEVLEVQRSNYGLVVKGRFQRDLSPFQCFCPFELPPNLEGYKRFGEFLGYAFIETQEGIKLGDVCFGHSEHPEKKTPVGYDKAWEASVQPIRIGALKDMQT